MAEQIDQTNLRKALSNVFQGARTSPGTALILSILLVVLDVTTFKFNGFMVDQIPKVLANAWQVLLNAFITVFLIALALYFIFNRLSLGTENKNLVFMTAGIVASIFIFGGFSNPGAILHLMFPFLFLYFMSGENLSFEERLKFVNVLWIIDFYGYSLLSHFFTWAIGLRLAFSIYVLLALAAGLRQAEGFLRTLFYLLMVLFYFFLIVGNLSAQVAAVDLVDDLTNKDVLGAMKLIKAGTQGFKNFGASVMSPFEELDRILNPEKYNEDKDTKPAGEKTIKMYFVDQSEEPRRYYDGQTATIGLQIDSKTDNSHKVSLSCSATPDKDSLEVVEGTVDVGSPYSLKSEESLLVFCRLPLTAGDYERASYDVEFKALFESEKLETYYDVTLAKESVYLTPKIDEILPKFPKPAGSYVVLNIMSDGSIWKIYDEGTTTKPFKVKIQNSASGDIVAVKSLGVTLPKEFRLGGCDPEMSGSGGTYTANSQDLQNIEEISTGKVFACRLEYSPDSFSSLINDRTLAANIVYDYEIIKTMQIRVEKQDEET